MKRSPQSACMYDDSFYLSRHAQTSYSASQIIPIVSKAIPRMDSVIDIGCGVGTFLLACKQEGASKIRGMEGYWLSLEHLRIDRHDFEFIDLESDILSVGNYDLAICLEVAEHLSEENGTRLVRSLCGLSRSVLFSAAIPSQGGIGHVNEAWQSYWAQQFAQLGFKPYDIIRPSIWGDVDIPFWYRQNIVLYSSLPDLSCRASEKHSLDLVHPDLYEMKLQPPTPIDRNRLLGALRKLYRRIS